VRVVYGRHAAPPRDHYAARFNFGSLGRLDWLVQEKRHSASRKREQPAKDLALPLPRAEVCPLPAR